MSETVSTTSRRDFLKTGALVSAPLAMAAPAIALAADDSAARLALLQDERAIEGLMRSFLRRFNGVDGADCGSFVARADAIRIAPQVRAIVADDTADPVLAITDDGAQARWQAAAKVDWVEEFGTGTTLEKMARFQGQTRAVTSSRRQIAAELARSANGWQITALTLTEA